MLQLRVVCPENEADEVLTLVADQVGTVAVTRTSSSDGAIVCADIAREGVDELLDELRARRVLEHGMVTLTPLDTALGHLADRAEADAPGEGADALIWDDLASRTGEDSILTWTFGAFMVLAAVLAAIGIVTNSTITIVGAMVVGPEFGPLAAVAVGLVGRRGAIVRRAAVAVVTGFVLAIVATAGLSLLGRAAGLFDVSTLDNHDQTEFIYHPGWFSLITAVVAGAAGTLSLTSSKSAALVGVFISVTTIPAAGNVAVAATCGLWYQAGQSLLQLGINLVGIVVAGVLTLMALQSVQARRDDRRARAVSRARAA